MNGTRALSYIRVSVVGGRAVRGRFESPDIQREANSTWAQRRGVTIVGEIQDLNRSGGTLTRPGLDEALARLAAGEADGIIVARSDRASRNVIQGLSLIDELDAAGKWIAAADGTIDSTTPEGRMTTTVILATSERELARYRQQSAETHRRAIVEKGRHMGPAPFGYIRDGDGRLVEDPDRAPIVRQVFQRRADGIGWLQIVREVSHVRQVNGRKVTPHLLRRMVTRRVYLGEAHHQQHVKVDAHPALVDPALWSAANKAIGTVSTAPPDATYVTPPSLLRGLIRCAGCRYTMKRLASRKQVRWQCRTISPEPSATHDCTAPAKLRNLEHRELERIVVERFFVLATSEALQQATDHPDLERLDVDRKRAQGEVDELSSLELRRQLGADRWGKLVAEASREAERTQQEYESALARVKVSPTGDRATLEQIWEVMDLEERQEALRRIVQCVMVGDGDGDVADRIVIVPTWDPVDVPRRGIQNFVARPFGDGD